MWRIFALAGLLSLTMAAADRDFNGRWNITVPNESRARVWWLEVSGAGTPNVSGRFVGAPGGQLDTIPRIAINDGELEFVFERHYAAPRSAPPNRGIYRARIVEGRLQGTFDVEGVPGRALNWTGVRAPEIAETDDGSWKPGAPVEVFNGRDLTGWRSRLPNREIGWSVKDGLLNNGTTPAPDLVSDAKFWNFALHVEYRIGKGSNSGIGLRGRYEIQIYDDFGKEPSLHGNGAVYSRIVPAKNASYAPGEWQTMDIRLVGRTVTVVLNDQKIIDRQLIEGLTAIASDPREDQPGPLILQGDHGPVEFRKITVTPLTRK
jgi:hypothetical protein